MPMRYALIIPAWNEADFIGKAALQRVLAEGPERLLVGLNIGADIGDEWLLPERTPVLFDGEQVGCASAIVWSPRLQRTVGIAQVQREVVEAGELVTVFGPRGMHTATITSLPFA